MSGVKVLLVDDEPMFVEAVAALLEHDERIDVVGTALSGEAAVELARARKPDVALVDLTLPDVDGFELTRRLVAGDGLAVVAVSGLSSPADADRALAAGATRFLLKGGLYEEVADAILEASRQTAEAGS